MARQASPQSDFDTPRSCRSQSAASTIPARSDRRAADGLQLGRQAAPARPGECRLPCLSPTRLPAAPVLGELRVGRPASPSATLFGCDYGILFRIRVWFVIVYVGSVFRPPWGRNSLFLHRISTTLDGAALLPDAFQALDPGFHLLRALDVPAARARGRGSRGRVLVHSSPVETVFLAVSRIWVMAFARDRRPAAQPAHRAALRLCLLRQPHEFSVARGDRRKVEAVGLDDMAFRMPRLP